MAADNDSKLNLVLFSTELQRRLAASGSPVKSIIAHPGIAATNLARHSSSGKVTGALRFPFNDAEHGALPSLFAATQDIPGNSYVGPRGLGSQANSPNVRNRWVNHVFDHLYSATFASKSGIPVDALLRALRCLGERGFALLTQRWKALQQKTLVEHRRPLSYPSQPGMDGEGPTGFGMAGWNCEFITVVDGGTAGQRVPLGGVTPVSR